jgi:hypothetical protein
MESIPIQSITKAKQDGSKNDLVEDTIPSPSLEDQRVEGHKSN